MGKKDNSKNTKGGTAAIPTTIVSKTALGCAYTPTGDFPVDFSELWQRYYPDHAEPPLVKPRHNIQPGELVNKSLPTTFVTVPNVQLYHPSVQCDFEVEETKSMKINYAKDLYIRSWKMPMKVVDIFRKCVLDKLKILNLWNVGLSEDCVAALGAALTNVPSIKVVVIEGNPIPKSEPFHLLVQGNTSLTKLSLRNNCITDVGAKSISKVLTSLSCPLINVNLSFNKIGDEGAKALAKALRLNRTLASLSLSSNLIEDVGCIAIASSLKQIALTREEVVERRRMNLDSLMRSFETPRDRGVTASKSTGIGGKGLKTTIKKGGKQELSNKKNEVQDKSKGVNKKSEKPTVTIKTPTRKGGKSTYLELQGNDPSEFQHPLLHPKTEFIDGKVYIPGCLSLICLNLSRNLIGEDGLFALLQVVEHHQLIEKPSLGYLERPGLIRLYIQNNKFSEEHPQYLKIQDILTQRDPLMQLEED